MLVMAYPLATVPVITGRTGTGCRYGWWRAVTITVTLGGNICIPLELTLRPVLSNSCGTMVSDVFCVNCALLRARRAATTLLTTWLGPTMVRVDGLREKRGSR